MTTRRHYDRALDERLRMTEDVRLVERLERYGEGKLLGGMVSIPTGDFREVLAIVKKALASQTGGV